MNRKYQNHVVDPTFFYDAIAQFNFSYDWIVENKRTIDEYGRLSFGYDRKVIQGSLQTQGLRVIQRKEGNTQENVYMFYCKSLYRIKTGDFIYYKGNYLLVDEVHEYDEYGVREARLIMVQLAQYRDLQEYIKFLEGELIV